MNDVPQPPDASGAFPPPEEPVPPAAPGGFAAPPPPPAAPGGFDAAPPPPAAPGGFDAPPPPAAPGGFVPPPPAAPGGFVPPPPAAPGGFAPPPAAPGGFAPPPAAPGAPGAYGAVPPYPGAEVKPPTNALAIASLVCGILAIFPGFCCFPIAVIGGLVAIGLGIPAMAKANRGEAGGKGLAIAGIACGGVGLALIVVGFILGFATSAFNVDTYNSSAAAVLAGLGRV